MLSVSNWLLVEWIAAW